jgi:hypothetical protein
MPRSDLRTLINRGRKAGLQTSELYSALSGRRPEADEIRSVGGDCNGFASGVDAAGHQVYIRVPSHRQ